MERLKLSLYATAAVMVAFGVYVRFVVNPKVHAKTEQELCALAPAKVGDYAFVENPQTPGQTYKMDQRTYDTLQPFGIVSRVYQSPRDSYDVVLIVSENKQSFHDPRWCFDAQGWQILQDNITTIRTKTCGEVPVAVVMLGQDKTRRAAAFFYKGPGGYFASMRSMQFAIMKAAITGHPNLTGTFYRFMPTNESTSVDQLLAFTAEYLDAAKASSGGYY